MKTVVYALETLEDGYIQDENDWVSLLVLKAFMAICMHIGSERFPNLKL